MIYSLQIKFDKYSRPNVILYFSKNYRIRTLFIYLLSGAVSKGSYINLSQKQKNLLTKFQDFEC